MIGRTEFDPEGDDRTPLQKEYGARTGKFGDGEGATFTGLDSRAEALARLAKLQEEQDIGGGQVPS